MALIIVRHGRTEANASGLLLGRADPPLDDLGRTQAAAVADAMDAPIRVISSPLRRARETAEALGVDVEVDDRWIELDYGEWDGMPVTSIPADVWAEWRADPDFAPPGGESLQTLRARVDAACADLIDDARHDDIVVVTHVSPVKAALGWTLGMDEQVNWRTFVAPASITTVGLGPVGPTLRGFNETRHLDPLAQ